MQAVPILTPVSLHVEQSRPVIVVVRSASRGTCVWQSVNSGASGRTRWHSLVVSSSTTVITRISGAGRSTLVFERSNVRSVIRLIPFTFLVM